MEQIKPQHTLSFNNENIDYWVISDPHFGHKNIIKYDNRPFTEIKEHDRTIIENWNNIVKTTDIIFILGDFALTSKYYTRSILERLNGIKYFLKGNHDKTQNIKLFKEFGTLLQPIHKVNILNQLFVLSHYPIESWEGMNAQQSIHFHGHTHRADILRKIKNRYSVVCNLNNYTPILMTKHKPL